MEMLVKAFEVGWWDGYHRSDECRSVGCLECGSCTFTPEMRFMGSRLLHFE